MQEGILKLQFYNDNKKNERKEINTRLTLLHHVTLLTLHFSDFILQTFLIA